MTNAEKTVIANEANKEAAQSRQRGAPVLSADSSTATLCRWLQWNDPNGSHTPELAKAEDLEPYTNEEAWTVIREMLS